MSFDLRIHFVGLAMYVPQPKEGESGEKMHVLLPSTRGHVHGGGVHGHEHSDGGGTATADPAATGAQPGGASGAEEQKVAEHFAGIVYDEAYETPGQTQLSRTYKIVDFEGRVLDLTGLGSREGIDIRLPGELAPLDRVAKPVDRSLVDNLPDERLAGRVTMDAGALTDYSLGAKYTLGDSGPQRMTLSTEWTIRGIPDPDPEKGPPVLRARILQHADGDEPTHLVLHPIGQTIHLMVFHTIGSEFPPNGRSFRPPPLLEEGEEETPHFKAYYTVCEKREEVEEADSIPAVVEKTPLVRVVKEGKGPKPGGPEFPSMTCVQTQAPLG